MPVPHFACAPRPSRRPLRAGVAVLLAAVALIAAAPRLAAEVDITAAWLAAAGSPPYVLDSANETYVLQEDVDAPCTTFVITASGVTFDLNGHTITYGDSAASVVTNGGFEQGSGTTVPGWNLAGAPTAVLVPNTTFLFGNQVLRLASFSTPQTIVSDPVPITLVNHTYVATITPSGLLVDYGTVLTLSVIDHVTQQVLGTGQTSGNIQRGFSAVAPFTPTTTDAVVLSITVTPPTGMATTIDLDEATLTASYDYGILASADWFGDLPDYGAGYPNLPPAVRAAYNTNWTTRGNITITNGTIVQGHGAGSYSSPLLLEGLHGVTVDHVTTTDSGLDTRNVDCLYAQGPIAITNSSFTDTAPNVANRTQGPSTIALGSVSGNVLVQGNRVLGSPQVGISASGAVPSIIIDSNFISQASAVADSAGIAIVGLTNFQITNNTIQPVAGQGLMLDGFAVQGTSHGIIQNNLVETQEYPNRETGLGEIARALRMRNDGEDGGPQTDIDVSGNTLSTTVGPGLAPTCYTAWISYNNNGGAMNNAGITLHDNHIIAIAQSADPTYSAQAMVVDTLDPLIDLPLDNNIFESNDTSLAIGGYNDGGIYDLDVISDTFRRSTAGAVRPYTAVQVGYDTTKVADVRIIDPVLDQGATWTLFWTGSGIKTLSTGWTVDVLVEDASSHGLPGAAVTVSTSGAVVASATSGADGTTGGIPVVTLIQSQATTDPTKISSQPQGPATITATLAGASATTEVTLSAPTSVSLILPDPAGTGSGSSGSSGTAGGATGSLAGGGGSSSGSGGCGLGVASVRSCSVGGGGGGGWAEASPADRIAAAVQDISSVPRRMGAARAQRDASGMAPVWSCSSRRGRRPAPAPAPPVPHGRHRARWRASTGVHPHQARKTALKCDALGKPSCAPIAATASSVVLSSRSASARRWRWRYACGVMP